MLIGAVAALLAALCWTLSSGIWRRVPTSLSALQLNLLKNLIGSLTLLPVLLWPGAWQGVSAPTLLALMLSGALGIALGDSFYFAALRRLGTRRSLTLDAGGPALSALLAQLTLAESLQPQQWLAVALISLGGFDRGAASPAGWCSRAGTGAGIAVYRLGAALRLGGGLAVALGLGWQQLAAAHGSGGALAGGVGGDAALGALALQAATPPGHGALAPGAAGHLVGHQLGNRAAAGELAAAAGWAGRELAGHGAVDGPSPQSFGG